jgi:hypothetical protein
MPLFLSRDQPSSSANSHKRIVGSLFTNTNHPPTHPFLAELASGPPQAQKKRSRETKRSSLWWLGTVQPLLRALLLADERRRAVVLFIKEHPPSTAPSLLQPMAPQPRPDSCNPCLHLAYFTTLSCSAADQTYSPFASGRTAENSSLSTAACALPSASRWVRPARTHGCFLICA